MTRAQKLLTLCLHCRRVFAPPLPSMIFCSKRCKSQYSREATARQLRYDAISADGGASLRRTEDQKIRNHDNA